MAQSDRVSDCPLSVINMWVALIKCVKTYTGAPVKKI